MERLQLWLPRGGDQARRSMLPPDADALHDAFKHPTPSARPCRQETVDPPASQPGHRHTPTLKARSTSGAAL